MPPAPSRSFRSSCGTRKQNASLGDTVLINRKLLIIIIVGLRIIRGCRAQPHPPPHTHTERAPEGKVTPRQDGKFLSRFVISPHHTEHFPWHRSAGTPSKPFATQTQHLHWSCVWDSPSQSCPRHPDPVVPNSSWSLTTEGTGGRWEPESRRMLCPRAHWDSSSHEPPTPG